MKAGKRKEAQDLIEAKLLGPFSQVYLPLGDIIMSFDQQGGEHYSRQLDFETATADTEYSCGSTKIRRRCYCSCPDDVLVYEIISSNPISFTVQMTSQLHHEVVYTAHGVHMTGKAPDNIVIADVYHFFEGQNTISYDAPDKGTDFCAQLRIETDGDVSGGTALRVSGCTRAVLYYTSATSYRYKECDARCSDVLDRAEKKGAVRIFDDHRADFGELYNRVDLSLDAPTVVSTREFFSPGNEGAK
ncbi:MAG: glycoside hydrolase N-terminal domain-containing protein, partial [Oscillospiraceae bacterium]